MEILVLNCGSSSVKYQLFQMDTETAQASGIVEEVGLGRPRLKHKRPGQEDLTWEDLQIANHREAIQSVLDVLQDPEHGVIADISHLDAVGHRVVHGGERFASSVRIDDEVIRAISAVIELAPLHNPPNIEGIKAIAGLLPDIPQVAVFDTAFHQTMPADAYLYAIPYEYYEKYGIRRYGFHGTSHRYVAQQAARHLGRPLEELRMVTCHLGNGASATAVLYGRSVDTSMGFTPLEGLVMGTRSGDLDPAIVPYLMDKEGLDRSAIDDLLNKRSGVLGLSQIDSDMRVLEDAYLAGPADPRYERALLVLKVYCRRLRKYIGAYAAVMGGLDCLVFTGGVGENFKEICDWTCEGLEFLGIRGVRARRAGGQIVVASAADSPATVLIVPTNEELAIARDTLAIINGSIAAERR